MPSLNWEVGSSAPTRRIVLSPNLGIAATDPFGEITGRHWRLTEPGLYCLGFHLVDNSTNGIDGSPVHIPSPVYQVYLQAGFTIDELTRQSSSATVCFGAEPGWQYSLEYRSGLIPSGTWESVAGPVPGLGRLQSLTATNLHQGNGFFRLRKE